MSWASRTFATACAALAFAACSSSDAKGSPAVNLPVLWSDYTPGLQAKIDAMASAKDCDGMQAEFNQIGGTNLVVRARFGHGNVEVLQYIDDKERQANCFDSTVASTGS
jgi:hypothetical protein